MRPAWHLPTAFLATVLAAALAPAVSTAQRAAASADGAVRSAPVSNIRYEVTFDTQTAQRRSIHLEMTFDAASTAPVLLSLPVWTPGAYEVSNYAHWVYGFGATARGGKVPWDKADPDTWRIRPPAAGPVTVSFDYVADSLDNAMAWSRSDFAFFNGTNLFLYPEGRGYGFPATVTVRTGPGWKVATGMRARPGRFTYGESSYHDLVDMPFFVGRFDLDSARVAGKWIRLATYPAGVLADSARATMWQAIARVVPVEAAVFGETPWPDYTLLLAFPAGGTRGGALEHSRSHLGLYGTGLIGDPELFSITAHEIFHGWNVKRLRPAEMWPYAYDRAQPTPWLWVSEGITDYYAALVLARAGLGEAYLWRDLTRKAAEVADAPAVALEDASLSTWVHPRDGTGYLYYPKGALAGFLLDVMIRDASDNRRSLDAVMRELYDADYRHGRGFTAAEWWGAVSRAAGGRSFADFAARYVDGREPFPYAQVLPLAGLRIQEDTQRVVRLGVQTQTDSAGERVVAVVPGGMGERAGIRVGDFLLRLGDVDVRRGDFGPAYRARYGSRPEGTRFPIVVRRGGQEVSLNGFVHFAAETSRRIAPDPNATPKAVRIRNGIARGATDG